MRPGVLVGISVAFVGVWFLVFEACTPTLPQEGPISVTVARDAGR